MLIKCCSIPLRDTNVVDYIKFFRIAGTEIRKSRKQTGRCHLYVAPAVCFKDST